MAMQHNWLCMLLEERKQGQPPLKRSGTDEGITDAMKKCDMVVTKMDAAMQQHFPAWASKPAAAAAAAANSAAEASDEQTQRMADDDDDDDDDEDDVAPGVAPG